MKPWRKPSARQLIWGVACAEAVAICGIAAISIGGNHDDRRASPHVAKPRSAIEVELTRIIGHGPTEVIDPEVRIEEEVDAGDHVRRLLSYWVEPADRAFGYLLIPQPLPSANDRRPLVLCPHKTVAFGKDLPAGLQGNPQLHYALHLVRRGFVCFAPDQFWAGQRLRPGAKPWDTSELYRRWPDWSAGGKAVWDLQRALDFLVGYDFVDPDRIGAIGYSLGGHDTLMLAAFDPRIKAAVVNRGVAVIRTDPRRERWARPDPEDYTYYPRLRPYLKDPENLPFDFDRVAMLVAPRPLLLIAKFQGGSSGAGWLDAVGPISERYARSAAPGAFAVYFHRQEDHFPAEARELAYAWLADHLSTRDGLTMAKAAAGTTFRGTGE